MAGVLGTSDDRLVLKHNANPDHDDRIERNPFTSNYPLLGSNFDHGSAGYGPDLFPSHPPSWQGFQPLPNGSASWDIPFVDGPWGSFADFYSHDAKRKVQDINSAPNEDAVSCYSACGASCPSQCGETGKAICCDDDECVSVQICRDEQCQEARHPCSDKSCIGTPISPHVDPFNPYKGGDEAAARALTSFGHEWGPGTLDDGVEMDYQGFEDTTMGLYTATGDYELPGMIPCSELSSDAFFTDILGSSLDTHKLPAEIYLARHIVQRHLQVGPGSHHPPCVTDNPGQVISECSLPVPSQHDLMPKDTCGFVVQDPAEFVNHISLHHGLQILPPSWSDLPLDSLPASSGISTQSFDHSMGLSATDQTLSPAMIMQANEPWHSRRSSGSSGSSSQSAGFSPSQKPSRTPATPISTPASLRRTLLHGSSESNAENAQSLQSKASHIKGSNEPPNQLHTTHDQIAECQWVMGDGGEICGRKFASTHLLQAHCKNDHTHRLRMSGCGYWCKWSGCERTEPFQQISKLDRHLQSHTKGMSATRSCVFEQMADFH